ncbi:hypothetical protein DPMN_078910 [Dreissena polymorpha]|uniref:Uncharacterized protein n=1 Tax=Dreissena polymorpha TaxID=45954 RepID=A0A9D4BQV3_DREPO|nr:hypothetical protein DPMN_078910 [Dreissena polymorpha]
MATAVIARLSSLWTISAISCPTKHKLWRPSNDESWLGFDTSPDTTLCAGLCSKER